MSYRVFWAPKAEEELAAIWIAADDRDLITRTAYRIDSKLSVNPGTAGESRDKERRIFLEPPLGVIFAVSEPDRRVLVLNVWRFDPRRRS